MSRLAKSFAAMRRLRSDEAGTSILELALCSPILVTFLVGIVDVAMYAAARMQVGQAVYRGMEIVQVNTSSQSDATIQSEVAAAAGYGVANTDVGVSRALYCDGTAPLAGITSCDDGEEIARYVTISAAAEYEPFLGSMTTLFFSNAVNGKIPFTIAASVRVQ